MLELHNAHIKIAPQCYLTIDHFTLTKPHFAVVVGHNGSGKSTLAQFISQGKPCERGEYQNYFQRPALLSLRVHQKLIERIAYELNDDTRSPDDHGPSAQQIILENATQPSTLPRIAAQLGITALLSTPFKLLSTGQARKVLLAKSLINAPDLLILDEPFEGLDHASQAQWQTLIAQLSQSCCVVLILNRLHDIPPAAQSVTLLSHCHQVLQAPFAEVQQNPIFQQLCYAENATHQAIPAPLSPASPLTCALLFDLKEVSVQFGEKMILDKLSWQVKSGEHWWIKGGNGCGKSTLLSLITGDHPQAFNNHVHIFGRQRGSGETVWEIKQHIGYVSNQLHLDYRVNCCALDVIISGFFDSIGVYQHVDEPTRLRAMQWLERLNLTALANRPFKSLSFGQQRLLLIARAMVKHPPVLILDEPLMGLDALNRHLVLTFIEQLIDNSQTQLIFVSHHDEDQPRCINHTLTFIANGTGYDYHQGIV
ncbi:molybdate ABC transporter ATP-binding protein ModF [Pasteurellaceae bacterium HPA106]|uniref:molybdate ABC transporter ATP-binding protein ModF n=1 Tax=Spirabiliibacterium pneumoniae TaxID=221400 RepID=UPI001AAD9513|nr:molybdate ABC transporter ATP-binding protein ModF [Spirabiliibacterium pneumoniae]MBE2895420.1 molybdate ABC transporter ATP-binding protein ModF [Spirabiliibacterium pneumoniae]